MSLYSHLNGRQTTTDMIVLTVYFIVLCLVLGSDCKSESGSNTDSEMAGTYPHEDAADLAYKKSEETYQEWDKYWSEVMNSRSDSILTITQGIHMRTSCMTQTL